MCQHLLQHAKITSTKCHDLYPYSQAELGAVGSSQAVDLHKPVEVGEGSIPEDERHVGTVSTTIATGRASLIDSSHSRLAEDIRRHRSPPAAHSPPAARNPADSHRSLAEEVLRSTRDEVRC